MLQAKKNKFQKIDTFNELETFDIVIDYELENIVKK